MSERSLHEAEIPDIADDILKSTYAKHLIREEANRQIDAWIKLRILPATALLVVIATFFGWKTFDLSKSLETLQKKIDEMPKSIAESEAHVQVMVAQIQGAEGLIDSAKQAAAVGNQAAEQGERTVEASLGLVKDTGATVKDANNLLGKVNGDLNKANGDIQKVQNDIGGLNIRTDAANGSLTSVTQKLDALNKNEATIGQKYNELLNGVEEVKAAIRRMRVFHIQVLTTGRTTNNNVVFGDPDGKRRPYTMRFVALSPTDSHGDYFTTLLSIDGPGPEPRSICIASREITLDLRQPFELATLKSFERIPNCLPDGVKLYIDATPHDFGAAVKTTQPQVDFLILRVDTDLSNSPVSGQ